VYVEPPSWLRSEVVQVRLIPARAEQATETFPTRRLSPTLSRPRLQGATHESISSVAPAAALYVVS